MSMPLYLHVVAVASNYARMKPVMLIETKWKSSSAYCSNIGTVVKKCITTATVTARPESFIPCARLDSIAARLVHLLS